ncbi:MAG: CapA family protein [Archangium sp.]|nr:CapA family protein [Archangium sp.]
MNAELPREPRELARFGWRQALAYDGVGALARLVGAWRAPSPRRSGDLASMQFLDFAYWFHKSTHPIRTAEAGSGLEAFFAAQRFKWAPPDDLSPVAELTLSSAGDLMSHAYLARSGDSLYREVSDLLFGADISMANLECVVMKDPAPLHIDVEKGPPLAFDHDAFRASAGRFDFLATACNHSLDFGAEGVDSTIAALLASGKAFNGVNRCAADASRATIVERRGVRLGVLAHTFGLNGHRPQRVGIVNHSRLNERGVDLTLFEQQLAHCREVAVDFVIAHLHWGFEFEYFPRLTQLELAHRLAELGVDAIFGHHPHVVQPVEYYRTKRDPHRVVPIFYSLGNLITPFSIDYMRRSGVARIELVKGRTKTYVRAAGLVEVEQQVDAERKELVLRACGREENAY